VLLTGNTFLPIFLARTGTLDPEITRQMFYHCATNCQYISLDFLAFLSPGAGNGGRTGTLDLEIMRRMFYHCAANWQYISSDFFTFLSPSTGNGLSVVNTVPDDQA